MFCRRPERIQFPFLLALSLPAAAVGQDVTVRAIDDVSGRPVPGAIVTVFDSAGWTVQRRETGPTGAFVLAFPAPGAYQIWTTGLGFESVLSRTVRIDPAIAEIEIRLRPEPLTVAPVRVLAEARRQVLQAVGFYDRLELGVGQFVGAEDPELREATRVTDALRTQPSVRVVLDSGGDGGVGTAVVFRNARRGFDADGTRACLPSLVIDGTQVRRGGPLPAPARLGGSARERPVLLDELVHPAEIAGMELYPSGSGAPVQWAGTAARCGVVVVWTKWARPD